MASEQGVEGAVDLHVENVGGISRTDVTFDPGVVVLTGRNATNRTSLLRAIMAAMGSDDASLRGGADEGRVELSFDGTTYTRTLTRRNGEVVLDGEPYLDDPELGDLFAFLLESNEARRAVLRDEDLRELVMRPVDTEAIEAQIEELEARRRELDTELDELAALEEELADRESERSRLKAELEDAREQLAAKEAELEAADQSIERGRQQQSELDEQLDELREARSSLHDVKKDLEIERRTVERLREQRTELLERLEAIPEVPSDELDGITSRIDDLRERKQELESDVNELLRIVQFNEELLSGDRQIAPPAADEEDPVTDRLLEGGERAICWTCGSKVDTAQIEATLDHLRERREHLAQRRNEVRSELEQLTERRKRLKRQREERRTVANRLERLEEDLATHEGAIDEYQASRDDLRARVNRLERAVDELEEEADYSDVFDLHREVNELELRVQRLKERRADLDDDIASIEERLEERSQLTTRRAEVQSNLADLRTQVDRIEARLVETFNEEMETVLDLLDYRNVERVWLERVESGGGPTVATQEFRLHVIRSTESDTVYEDTVDHLSESEREVTGLVFALAGYLAHDVHEELPFVLLDSLEAIDSQRIAAFVAYIADYADYLVVALLPEDAQALDSDYQRIADI